MTQQHTTQAHIVVVGAGQIGTPVVERLARDGHQVTWLSRTTPRHIPDGARHVSIDATDPVALAHAARGARVVIAAINPSVYDAKVWAQTLPGLHAGLIGGVTRVGARLVLLDALYLYALDQGPLSPETPQRPTTQKGKIRKQVADMVREAQQRAGLRVSVLRASDFWGPQLSSALLTEAGVTQLKAHKRPFLIGDPDQPHAFSHRDDVVDALINLAFAEDDVEGRVFHAPVIHVPPRLLVGAVAKALDARAEPFVAPRWLLRLVGLFSRSTAGMVEMLPQWQAPYLVDDSGYRQRFAAGAISLEQGVAQLAAAG